MSDRLVLNRNFVQTATRIPGFRNLAIHRHLSPPDQDIRFLFLEQMPAWERYLFATDSVFAIN